MNDPRAPIPEGRGPATKAVVLAPDLIAESLIDDDSARVLLLWREGRIRPLLTRGLLARYLRTLHRVGLPERLLRRWAWWFGSPDKCGLLELSGPEASTGWALCQQAARAGGTSCVVHANRSKPPPTLLEQPSVHCVRAADFGIGIGVKL